MKFLSCLLISLLSLFAAGAVNAQTGAMDSKPRYVKFRTDPPGGIVIVSGNTYQTSDSDVVWTKVELSPGTHPVVVKGEAKKFTFDLPVDAKLGMYVTVEFDEGQVWSLLEKGYRSNPIAVTVEPDNSTTVTKRKKDKVDSTALAAQKKSKDTTTTNTTAAATAAAGGIPKLEVFVAVEEPPQMLSYVQPQYEDSTKAAQFKGTVLVKVLVDEQGNVDEAKIDKTSGNKIVDRGVLDAAKKCKYRPAINQGKTEAVWVSYRVEIKP